MSTYWGIFFLATVLSLLATAGLRLAALRLNLLDQPSVGRIHSRAVPRVGGLAIVAPICLLLWLHDRWQGPNPTVQPLWAILLAGLAIMLLGLVDDVRGIRARFKLLGQIICALAVCAAGVRLEEVSLPGLFTASLGWASWPVTVLWIVSMTNALNFIDGLDGLAAGISVLAATMVLIVALAAGNVVLAMTMVLLLGGLVGFLCFNLPPARIFMGDCGSMFLGFALSSFSVLAARLAASTVGFLLPLLALGVPVADIFFTVIRRLRAGQRLWKPDCGHVHHRLLEAGMKPQEAVILIWGGSTLACGFASFMMLVRGSAILCLTGGGMLAVLLVFLRAERSLRARQGRADSTPAQSCVSLSQTMPDQHLLPLREARTFSSWWEAVCQTARQMDVAKLSLLVANRDGSVRQMVWTSGQGHVSDRLLRMIVPTPQSRLGPPLEMEAYFRVKSSLEEADRRALTFRQLVQRHSLVDLPSRRRKIALAS